jgi:hypothetical protein
VSEGQTAHLPNQLTSDLNTGMIGGRTEPHLA